MEFIGIGDKLKRRLQVVSDFNDSNVQNSFSKMRAGVFSIVILPKLVQHPKFDSY